LPPVVSSHRVVESIRPEAGNRQTAPVKQFPYAIPLQWAWKFLEGQQSASVARKQAGLRIRCFDCVRFPRFPAFRRSARFAQHHLGNDPTGATPILLGRFCNPHEHHAASHVWYASTRSRSTRVGQWWSTSTL
jgi:hypothetical protein